MVEETKTAPVVALAKQTKEVISMITEEDIGRISSGWDTDTDFDALPNRLADLTAADVQMAELFQGEVAVSEPAEFDEPVEQFPVFKHALRYFQGEATTPRAVRIDTDKSYEGFGIEKAVKEIERRTNELRAAVEQHMSDHHGGSVAPMRAWDEVLGAVGAISNIQASRDAKDAIDKLPQIPLTVPDDVKDQVKCWQDGEAVIVSMRFATPDGSPRVATMGAKPHIDEESIQNWAEQEGYDPVTILGVAPVLASVATGKRLVRQTAEAALEAQERPDVRSMDEADDEPLVMIGLGETTAPLAALMYLQQRAEAGDPQALEELAVMHAAALTPSGRRYAAPVLAEANRRLLHGRAEKHHEGSLAGRYAKLAAFV